ncbi:hypothetical protein N7448_009323 [Penicillium atrosanguineum]|uniref:Uncharacterized protein n=1 Tax=Penicillium atrosanguineum TaxID=1132637 RepID=A0A9W9U7X0_9EURO|nr:kinase-like domain-containing protein [Penicillium atrosanguineum]KAJ5123226.1 hypothetical protein N7448_009323 [Penicillium atrosanguineum]KAJ5141857.1 hypothetical protein N7526_002852 [Penicillium atrosanguineum]KAJ5298453.1 kinase-like domain-containing protein [Penicillium atrosanguineum]KAJ5321280.1 hypothetical protein N7476_004282 [Penicillium atrosanguineum]
MSPNVESIDFCQLTAALDPDKFQHAEDKANAKDAIRKMVPQVSPSEKKIAISKLDDINRRLMDRNISHNLDIGLGHIHW